MRIQLFYIVSLVNWKVISIVKLQLEVFNWTHSFSYGVQTWLDFFSSQRLTEFWKPKQIEFLLFEEYFFDISVRWPLFQYLVYVIVVPSNTANVINAKVFEVLD